MAINCCSSVHCQIVGVSVNYPPSFTCQLSACLSICSLHLTNMCVMYPPSTVACICINMALKWARQDVSSLLQCYMALAPTSVLYCDYHSKDVSSLFSVAWRWLRVVFCIVTTIARM